MREHDSKTWEIMGTKLVQLDQERPDSFNRRNGFLSNITEAPADEPKPWRPELPLPNPNKPPVFETGLGKPRVYRWGR